MINISHLSKSFKGRPALIDLTLDVAVGEIFGLLGHNGAGKSTTFGILLGHVYPDAGEARLRGISVQTDRLRALQGVGAIFETPAFYEYLSGWRNIELFSALSHPVSRAQIEETVELTGLTERIRDPVRVYSHGMRQRLALAQALLPKPEVILLDEPTEGLDPEGIHEIRNVIKRLAEEQKMTVFLSSHLLGEVEHLCDRVAILHRGRLVFNGHWAEFAGKDSLHRLTVDDWPLASATLLAHGFAIPEKGVVDAGDEDISKAVAALVAAGVKVRGVEKIRLSLEDFYLQKVAAEAAPSSR